MAAATHLQERVRRRLRNARAEARYRLGLREPGPGRAAISTAFRGTFDASARDRLLATYRHRFAGAVEAEIAEANRVRAHRFTFLGQTVDYGARIRWHLDPMSGREWPRGFSPAIVYRGEARLGDVKLPWELSKHQYFFTLGKAAWLTGNPEFALEIVAQIEDWIEANPYRRGVNWLSALEVGARTNSWILAYPFYAGHLDHAQHDRLARAAAQHMLFIEEHLSVGAYPNNHLIADAAALVIGGLFLDHRHSARWRQTGMHHLAHEIQRQVPDDGVHVEQCAAYHRFVLDQYHLVNALLAANGHTLDRRILDRMNRMTEYLMNVVLPDGSAAAFGDGDDARGLWLRNDAPSDYRSLLALGAVLFGRGDYKFAARGATEEILWLLGPAGLAAFDAVEPREPGQPSAAFRDGGYYVMRGGWGDRDPVLVFDCGPLGFGPGGHGHADALSFQLHAGGYPFLIDPGPYAYNIDYAWRDAFRSTRAHNTVVVDGEDQSVSAGRMAWSLKATALCRKWISTDEFDLVDGSHDGYERFADPVTHRRIIVFIRPGIWLLYDVVTGASPHDVELMLHLRPDCRVESGEGRFVLRSPSGAALFGGVIDRELQPLTPAVLEGSDRERHAWFSPGYGTRLPSRALSVRQRVAGSTVLTTWFAERPLAAISAAWVDEDLRIEIRAADGTEHRLLYRADGSAALEQNVDGRKSIVTVNDGGHVRRSGAGA